MLALKRQVNVSLIYFHLSFVGRFYLHQNDKIMTGVSKLPLEDKSSSN